jgi:hypothetical protein
MKKIEELFEIFKYSFLITLSFMFIFITIFNMMTLSQGPGPDEIPNILLYTSIMNNFLGIIALVPVFIGMKRGWFTLSGWFCFYIFFLLLNVVNGWIVNATGYLMLFLGIALILLLRNEEEK